MRTAARAAAPSRTELVKISVVGCGAVGSYYGAKLARAGEEVHFLLRSDYETVRRHGVRIQSPAGDFRVHPRCARAPQEIGASDVVLVALKTTANEAFPRLLPPLVGPGTAILTLQNGLGNEEALARSFPPEQILGGLCFVCLNRIEPGLIRHLDHGQIVLGEFQRYPEPRTHDIAGRLRNAGIPCKVTDKLAQAHWEKLVWNVPFNGLGVAGAAGYGAVVPHEGSDARPLASPAGCLPTDQLLADKRWEQLVRELMLEVIATARALGYDVDPALAEKQIERTRTMGTYKASTLVDFERGSPLEMQSLFLEPLRQARQAGVAVPRLERLCAVLSHLDPGAQR
jgi:2-dehydropantoate 2-reductase